MKRFLTAGLLCCLWTARVGAQATEGYYRYPTVHGNAIVFAAEGDLWIVGIDGGTARRLTTHAGEETHPVVSPDGNTLAFSATYEGPTELYTMPITGGLPTRQTYEASSSTAVGWTPDGRLLYVTQEYSTLPDPQIVAIDPATGERRRVPLTPAGDGVYNAQGNAFFFVSPADHANDTKRYKGGTARNIWKFVTGSNEAVNLTTDFAGENHSPMWHNGRIYYVCDRDGTMNIWSMDETGRNPRQHTRHSGWDVLSPDHHDGEIVYQLGADLWRLDLGNNRSTRIPIQLASDFDQLREKWVDKPMEYLTSAHLHPNGRSIVLTARGRVFVTPVSQGRFVQASRKQGVRYRDVVFLPGGDSLLALSDQSGEFEFWSLPANGVGDGRALTGDGKILRFRGHPSPDGKWVAYSDKNEDLWLLDVDNGGQKRISGNREGIAEISWSPDSRWLAYSMAAVNTYVQILLHHVEQGTTTALTSDRVNSRYPVWSPDGKFLYFLSDRNLESLVGSPWGPRQPEPYFDRTMKIYQIHLRADLRSPFQVDDELYGRTEVKEEQPSEESPLRIDLEGIQRRLKEVPVAAGNYSDLSVNGEALFWIERDTAPGSRNTLTAVKFGNQDPKPEKIVEGVRDYELSADGKKILVRMGDTLYVIDAAAKAPPNLESHKVDLSGWVFSMNVREDFRQLFIDAWRMERDYFYDPGMHGVEWNAMRDKYLPLVDRVTTRMELNDLIGQLVGELSALHVSVRGGDLRRGPDQIRVASLGARLVRDAGSGGYRIDYIYKADPEYPDALSPLADPGLGIREGDIIEGVNGTDTLSAPHINALLRGQQGRQVLLKVRSSADSESRLVVVKPTDDESDLRYRDWEYTRRLKVDAESDGQIGYVHLRAMGAGNLTEWYREFYPVFNRPGLIIDVRHNRGGNIDSIILSKLLRQAWFYWKPRVGEPYWNMQYAFRGHVVVLCNERTASDGEAFAEGFKRLGLGKVMGTRTWGGEIWLSNNNPMTDGGIARAPQTGVYGPEGIWLIEGHGVDPDIVVENLPHATFKGEDAQLAASIRFLQGEIKKNPIKVPQAPPYPDKSFPPKGPKEPR